MAILSKMYFNAVYGALAGCSAGCCFASWANAMPATRSRLLFSHLL